MPFVRHKKPTFRIRLPFGFIETENSWQDASTEFMIASPEELIAQLSCFWELRAGDVIFTGAPVNVPDARIGDVFDGSVEGIGSLKVQIVSENN